MANESSSAQSGTPMVQVRYGVRHAPLDAVGKTVGEIRAEMRERGWAIDGNVQALNANGAQPLDDNYRITGDGDLQLEFQRRQGEKG